MSNNMTCNVEKQKYFPQLSCTHTNIEMYRYLAYIDVSKGVCMLYLDQGEPGPLGPAGPVGDPGVGMIGLKVTLEENLVRSYLTLW